MNGKASKTLIGAFVVGAVILIVAGLMVFGGGKFMKKTQDFVLFFTGSVKGLSVGAPVLVGGVKIGSVKSLSIEYNHKTLTFYVPVIIEVQPNKIRLIKGKRIPIDKMVPLLIERGLRAQLTMGSLITGQLIIELAYYPDTPVKLVGLNKEYPEIPTIPSTFQAIFDTLKSLPLEKTLKGLMSAVKALEKILKSPEIPEILHSANLALADARKLINDVDSRVAPLADSVDDTLAEYRKFATNVNAQVDPLMGNANNTVKDARILVKSMDKKLEILATKIAKGLEASHGAMDQARETLEVIQSRLGKDSPLLNQLDNTLREFSEMARSIRSLANYLSRHPEALLRGKSGSQRR
ncbi:MAG: MCE family protein [Deltaproteobacteria bacterium]|nr:MCE family protein [Deltaproteobacteria bacterium]